RRPGRAGRPSPVPLAGRGARPGRARTGGLPGRRSPGGSPAAPWEDSSGAGSAPAGGVGPGELASLLHGHDELGEAGGPAVVAPGTAFRDQVDARLARGVKPARHAEVEDGPGRPVELEPEVLAVAANPEDLAPDERLPDPARGHPLVDDGIGRNLDA